MPRMMLPNHRGICRGIFYSAGAIRARNRRAVMRTRACEALGLRGISVFRKGGCCRYNRGEMATEWEVRIFENRQPVFEALFAGPLEMGRQDKGEEAPYALKTESGRARLILARLDEDRIPRQHDIVEPQTNGAARLTNPHKQVPVRLESGPVIQPGTSLDVA